MKRAISTDGAAAAIGPYSQAVVGGGLVFVSGQLGIDPDSGELAEGVAAQARRALRNMAAILEAGGADMGHVLKTTVLLRDINDFQAVNEVYAEFFTAPFPARACYQVAALPKGAAVEIEAVAALVD